MKLALKTMSLMALAVVASPAVMAEQTPWYGGINAGQSKAKIDDTRIRDGLQQGGFTTSSISHDDHDTGYKIFAGYRVNRNFAVEGGYVDLGKFGFTAATVPPGTLTGDIKIKGLNIDVVGFLPVTDKFSVFGRAGVIYAQTRDSFRGTGAVNVLNPNPSKNHADLKFGLGVQYDVSDALGLRLEAERYRVNDAVGNTGDVHLISAGLVYRFGGQASSAAPRQAFRETMPAAEPITAEPAMATESVVAAPAAVPPPSEFSSAPAAVAAESPPVPVIAAPPAASKASFSTDSLFDFNRTTVTPTGKQALDKFSADLQGVKYDAVNVTGHSDRLGEFSYNVKLSTRRAEEVKKYLVNSAHIPAARIAVRGVGPAEPVTEPGVCKGNERTAELIACLQPDRRVEVEVTGTK
ncbi:MAG: outer membrane beta-barrel protein [Pseudomonadota bacterium]